MKRIVIAWELGGGWGHLLPIRTLSQALDRRAHVELVLRDSAQTRVMSSQIQVLDAPVPTTPVADEIHETKSFSDLLHNVGFNDEAGLRDRVLRWRRIFETQRPDILVLDHAPAALLASRGLDVRRIGLNSGFFLPPIATPLGPFPLPKREPLEQAIAREGVVLDRCNAVLDTLGQRRMDRLSDLYAMLDHACLQTFEEFDHFPDRIGGDYFGVWPGDCVGERVEWPPGDGRRVYAYLKSSPCVPTILDTLARGKTPTIAYTPENTSQLRDRYAQTAVRCIETPVDIRQMTTECDLAILNGNHATSADFLRTAVPVFQVPLSIEQYLFTCRLATLGLSTMSLPNMPQHIVDTLRQLLTTSPRHDAVRVFAERYRDFDAAAEVERLVNLILS